jgi:hypothetical protein
MRGIRGRLILTGLTALSMALMTARPSFAADNDPLRFYDNDGFVVRGHFEAGLNAVSEQNLFWDFAATVAPAANYNPNKQWLEGYVKPGLSWSKSLDQYLTAYGKVSGVASGTEGLDAFEAGNTRRVTLEEGYIGLRAGNPDGRSVDVSIGPREFKAGTGMLLANGGTSGFERGALKLGPRKAWEFAALGRVAFDGFSGTGFLIDPNELPSSNTSTSIAGADFRYDGAPGHFAGLTLGHVVQSTAPYPKAAPGGIGPPSILANARDGLNFLNFYGRTNPFKGVLENLFVGIDFAYEWNRTIDLQAWGGRVQIGYVFTNLPWMPTLTYSYQTFSGDNPNTTKLERFDPLYFEGTPSSWSTGSKSSMVFINSNVNAHQVSLSVKPSERDTLTLRYTYIDANELLSPLQFGQATRLIVAGPNPALVAGVTTPHLSDDIFLEYTRAVTRNIYLTAGLSASVPGPGIASITPTKTPVWTGGFVNVVVSY